MINVQRDTMIFSTHQQKTDLGIGHQKKTNIWLRKSKSSVINGLPYRLVFRVVLLWLVGIDGEDFQGIYLRRRIKLFRSLNRLVSQSPLRDLTQWVFLLGSRILWIWVFYRVPMMWILPRTYRLVCMRHHWCLPMEWTTWASIVHQSMDWIQLASTTHNHQAERASFYQISHSRTYPRNTYPKNNSTNQPQRSPHSHYQIETTNQSQTCWQTFTIQDHTLTSCTRVDTPGYLHQAIHWTISPLLIWPILNPSICRTRLKLQVSFRNWMRSRGRLWSRLLFVRFSRIPRRILVVSSWWEVVGRKGDSIIITIFIIIITIIITIISVAF